MKQTATLKTKNAFVEDPKTSGALELNSIPHGSGNQLLGFFGVVTSFARNASLRVLKSLYSCIYGDQSESQTHPTWP